MPQNPFNDEENLQTFFEQDQRYNQIRSQSKDKILKTKFNLFIYIKKIIYLITHSTVLATIFTIVLFTTVTASAQILAPNKSKPATFLCQTFGRCDLLTGCPFGSQIIKPEILGQKYIWPTTGCLSRCVESVHIACDINNISLPNVIAIADGIIVNLYKNTGNGYGDTVEIDHGNGLVSLYAHLSEINVQKGQSVKQGEKIAQMGNTGASNEIHLHIEIKQDGVSQNPLKYFDQL